MSPLESYLTRMTPDNVWPAGHRPAEVAGQIHETVDREALILRWSSNSHCPMDDMLAAWVTLGVITMPQALATSAARRAEQDMVLAAYRADPPQPDAGQLAEMRAAFGPGAEVVNVITGQRFKV